MRIDIREWPFEDGDADGTAYEYHYAGWLYELSVGDRIYALRRYSTDRPERVDFMGTMHAPASADSAGMLGADEPIEGGVPYEDAAFVAAARWLLEQPGISRLTVFTRDPEHPDIPYVPVDPERLR